MRLVVVVVAGPLVVALTARGNRRHIRCLIHTQYLALRQRLLHCQPLKQLG